MIITVLGLITVIPSMLQLPIAVASYSTSTTDAFFLAMVVPGLVAAPLFNAVSSTLVPALFQARILPNNEEEKLAKSVTTILSATTAIGCLLIASGITALSRMHSTLIPALSVEMVAKFIWWMIPWVFLQSPMTVLQGFALTSNKPWLPSLATLLQQVSTTVFLFLLAGLGHSSGLPLSYIIGCFVQVAVLVAYMPGSWRLLKPGLFHTRSLIPLLIAARPICIGTLALQGGAIATRVIAAGFGPGTITALECATKLHNALLEITCTGVLTTSFARWSERIIANSVGVLRKDFIHTIKLSLFFLAPLAGALFIIRIPLLVTWLSKLYSTDPSLVVRAAELFGILVLSLPLEAAGRLSVRLYLAGHQTLTPSVLGIIRILMSLILILMLAPLASSLSLTLSETIASVITLILLLVSPTNKIKATLKPITIAIGRMVLPATLGGFFGHAVLSLLSSSNPPLRASLALVATIGAYVIASLLLNLPSTLEALSMVRSHTLFQAESRLAASHTSSGPNGN